MKLCKEILLGDSVLGRRFELTWKIRHNLPVKDLYVVVLPEDETKNLMEIYEYETLQKRKKFPCMVIAAASDKNEAIESVRILIETVNRETGGLDIRSYVEHKQR